MFYFCIFIIFFFVLCRATDINSLIDEVLLMEGNSGESLVFKRQYTPQVPANSDKYLPPLKVIVSGSSGNVQHNFPAFNSFTQSSLVTDSSGQNSQSLFIPTSTTPRPTPKPVIQQPLLPSTIQHQYQYGTWTFQGYLTGQPSQPQFQYQMFVPGAFSPGVVPPALVVPSGVVVPLSVSSGPNFNPFTTTGSSPSLIHSSGPEPPNSTPTQTVQIGAYKPSQPQVPQTQPQVPQIPQVAQISQNPSHPIIDQQQQQRPGLTQTSSSSINTHGTITSGSSLVYPVDSANAIPQTQAQPQQPVVIGQQTIRPTQITYRPPINQFGTSAGPSSIEPTGSTLTNYTPGINQIQSSIGQSHSQLTGSTQNTYRPDINQFGTSSASSPQAPVPTASYNPQQQNAIYNYDIRRPQYQAPAAPQGGK